MTARPVTDGQLAGIDALRARYDALRRRDQLAQAHARFEAAGAALIRNPGGQSAEPLTTAERLEMAEALARGGEVS